MTTASKYETITTSVYIPVPGSMIKKRDAQAIGELLEENKTRNGGDVDIDEVIAGKDDPSAPHYDYFTHDPGEAAEKCWRIEAKYIVRSIAKGVPRAIVDSEGETKEEIVTVRAFPSVQKQGNYAEGSFVSLSDVLTENDQDAQNRILISMYRYLLSAYERFSIHEELLGHLEHIRPILDRIGKQLLYSSEKVEAQILTVTNNAKQAKGG